MNKKTFIEVVNILDERRIFLEGRLNKYNERIDIIKEELELKKEDIKEINKLNLKIFEVKEELRQLALDLEKSLNDYVAYYHK